MTARLLVIEDDAALARQLAAWVGAAGSVDISSSDSLPEAGVHELALVGPGVPLAHELCGELIRTAPQLLVILLAERVSVTNAIDAIHAEATDLLRSSSGPAAILQAVQRALRREELRTELTALEQRALEGYVAGDLIGESGVMLALKRRLQRAAESDATVLVSGESGSGKDLAARFLHQHSHRRAGPFVVIGCGTIPTRLIESELFGHAKGAFTGAEQEHEGLLVRASGGSVLLDEVADLPLDVQPKLLRVLQERRVRPLGARREVAFDARVISTTHRDLAAEVRAGRFREDLYFRLNVLGITVPPLRARETDVLNLAQCFITRASNPKRLVRGLTPAAARELLERDWPGNVRELEHLISAAVASTQHDHVTLFSLLNASASPSTGLAAAQAAVPDESLSLASLAQLERAHIGEVLRSVQGNKTLAARILGVDRKTLYRKLRELALGDARAPEPSSPGG